MGPSSRVEDPHHHPTHPLLVFMPKLKMRFFALLWLAVSTASFSTAADESLTYQASSEPGVEDKIGTGKHIVFLAGDHEYRSEEALPALARMMAKHHGFKCTVLFNIDPDTGFIRPGNSNMPHTEKIADADLLVFGLRFQNLPDEQMQPIVDYLDRGGPVVGTRTSTHAFQIPKNSKYAKYDHRYRGDEMKGGFGRQILGETWVSHYGTNHVMSTRLVIAPEQAEHPILRGVTGAWVESGGYWVDPMPDSIVLANAQPLEGMTPDSPPAAGKDPCPGVWVRTYSGQDGTSGRVLTTTYGTSEDLRNDGFRRLMVNGIIWAVGEEDRITNDLKIDFVGPYHPSTFRFEGYRRGVKPLDLAGWDTPIMDPKKPTAK